MSCCASSYLPACICGDGTDGLRKSFSRRRQTGAIVKHQAPHVHRSALGGRNASLCARFFLGSRDVVHVALAVLVAQQNNVCRLRSQRTKYIIIEPKFRVKATVTLGLKVLSCGIGHKLDDSISSTDAAHPIGRALSCDGSSPRLTPRSSLTMNSYLKRRREVLRERGREGKGGGGGRTRSRSMRQRDGLQR